MTAPRLVPRYSSVTGKKLTVEIVTDADAAKADRQAIVEAIKGAPSIDGGVIDHYVPDADIESIASAVLDALDKGRGVDIVVRVGKVYQSSTKFDANIQLDPLTSETDETATDTEFWTQADLTALDGQRVEVVVRRAREPRP